MNLWRISATEVKNSWGRVVKRVLQRREPVLVESKGQQQLALLDEAERFAKTVADRHANQPLPDSADIIREMRDEPE